MQTHNTATGPISCQLARRAASGVPRSRGPAAAEARDSSHTRLGTLVFHVTQFQVRSSRSTMKQVQELPEKKPHDLSSQHLL